MSIKPNKRKANKAKRVARARKSQVLADRQLGTLQAVAGQPIGSIEAVKAARPDFPENEELTPKGRKLLIRAAKRLVESRLMEAGFTPRKNQTGYTVKNYETLTLVFGSTTQAEKDLYASLDIITDIMLGRPLLEEVDFEELAFGEAELGSVSHAEIQEVIARYHKNYKTVGGGTIRNIGLNKPGYDPVAQLAADRRDPNKFSLLKATSGKRIHVVLFGKLYSFGKSKSAAAGRR